jgi:hypothetical protein
MPVDRPTEPLPNGPSAASDVLALEAENEALRRRNVELEAHTGRHHTMGGALRSTAVVVLLALGTLLATVAVPTIWGRNLVLNTDRYVQTLAPLASNPGVQSAIVKVVDTQFQNNIDLSATLKDVLPPRASVLAGPLASAANGLVNTIATRFVQSDAFKTLWRELNRTAHTQIVAILTGKHSSANAVSIQHGTVVLNLAPLIDKIKQQLVSAGLTVAAQVPSVGATFEIAQVKGIEKAQRYVRFLNTLAYVLPILALACFVGAVLIARRHRRTVIAAGLCVAGGMLVLGLGLTLGRSIYLRDLPGTYMSSATAGQVYDTLIRYLRLGLRLLLVVALLVAAIAWMLGPSKAAASVRHGLLVPPRALSRRASTSQYAATLAAYRGLAITAIAVVGVLILALWTNPPLWVVLFVIAIAALLILALFWMQPPHTADSPDEAAPTQPGAPLTPGG